MEKMILPNFWNLHLAHKEKALETGNFLNNDDLLKAEAKKIKDNRMELGLSGIVGDLQFVIINTELETQEDALRDFLRYTGHDLYAAMENENEKVFVLKNDSIASADFLIKARKKDENPYLSYNIYPKTKHLPNTRLEAFVFECINIKKYYDIQKSRGVNVLTETIVETDSYFYIQTIPSSFTGFSYGLVEWKGEKKNYKDKNFTSLELDIKKPVDKYIDNIKALDHAATRILAKDRDAAILELMELTNYNFDFAIYVESMNSITSVARLGDFAIFNTHFSNFGEGLIMGKAFDDRAGCDVLISILKENYNCDLYGVFNVQEEVGERGAFVAAYGVKPDIGIALEGTICADMPNVPKHLSATEIGKGPAISIMDNTSIFNGSISKEIIRVAEENKIQYQLRRAVAGGNDAGAIHMSGVGAAVATVSVPCRYIHSSISVASKMDLENTKKLMIEYLKQI